MTNRQINDPILSTLLAEATANRLILRALIEAVLTQDQSKAWEELEAMVTRIEAIAKQTAGIKGAHKESSDKIMKVATGLATDFVRSIGPKPVRQ